MNNIKKLRLWVSFLGLLVFLPGSAAPAMQGAGQPTDSCVACHAKQENEDLSRAAKIYSGDIHRQAGLGCVGCHGGDSSSMDEKTSMDPKKGFLGAPEAKQVGPRCAKCHSDGEFMRRYNPKLRIDQWAEYQTSIHGQRNLTGDTKAATCISCHGIHSIKSVSDPSAPIYPLNVAATCGKCHSDAAYMSAYKIPTDQAAKYAKSIHAFNLIQKRDLSAPACNDCHGNHGAAPPGVKSVSFVCGQCHVRQQKLFAESAHRQPFEQGGLAACVTCHENHQVLSPSDTMLAKGEPGVCKNCHQAGEKGDAVSAQLLQAIQGLDQQYAQAHEILGRAERAGMEISKARFSLGEAHEKLIQARVLVHGVAPAPVSDVTNEGLRIAKESYSAGAAALEEVQFRRKGLLLSLVFILLAALGLFLKIRKMEKQASG